MFQTFKLCNMRDCHAHDVEPVPFDAVNPCRVFLHAETNTWYDELTGATIPVYTDGKDVSFDVQAWLFGQMQKAMEVWTTSTKVHEPYEHMRINHKPSRPAAKAPQHSCEELDAIADNFIRTRQDAKSLRNELYELGQEIHSFVKLQKKWSNNDAIDRHVDALREKRDSLRTVLADINRDCNVAKKHLHDDKKWTDRWMHRTGKWNDFVLVWQDPKTKSTWSIDRHGLKLRGHYIYLPEMDKSFIESANHAESQYGIPKNAWKKLCIPAESVGGSLRRYGKKNANGARINMRFEHKKYAETCVTLVRGLRNLGIQVKGLGSDDELFQYYLENVAPKLQSR